MNISPSCVLLQITLIASVGLEAAASPGIGIGIFGGPNSAILSYENRVNRYGLSGGLEGHLDWSSNDKYSLAVQMELAYTPRGAKIVGDGEYFGRYRQHYLDVIITARPEVLVHPFGFYMMMGGGSGFLLSASRDDAFGTTTDITRHLHRVDVLLRGGAGVAVHLPPRRAGPVSPSTIFLEVRYDHGLLDAEAPNNGFKTRTTSLMLGLSLSLKEPSTAPR